MSRPTLSARETYGARQVARRARQRQRVANRVYAAAADKPLLAPDPLYRPRATWVGRLGGMGALVVGSIVLHGAILFGFTAVGRAILSGRDNDALKSERVEVAMLEKKPEPPPREPEPLPKQETRKAPAPIKPAPVEPEVKKAEPPPDPINKQADPSPANATNRRIVGLSLESTTVGGGGPAFAVGNTRMGATDRVAKDPTEAAKPLAKENRISNRVPTAKVEFKPPQKIHAVKPEYPARLRTQSIEADVVLMVTIAVDGSVKDVSVVKSSSEAEFAASAVAAAKAEKYAPATKDGVPVEQVITFTVRFRLTDT